MSWSRNNFSIGVICRKGEMEMGGGKGKGEKKEEREREKDYTVKNSTKNESRETVNSLLIGNC